MIRVEQMTRKQLEEEVRFWRLESLHHDPVARSLMGKLGVTFLSGRLLSLLFKANGRELQSDFINERLGEPRGPRDDSDSAIRVRISLVRKAVGFDAIKNHGRAYSLTPKGLQIVRKALACKTNKAVA